jgi:hemerythrin-like domain-containing protein
MQEVRRFGQNSAHRSPEERSTATMSHLTRLLLQDHARINRAFDAYSNAPTSLDAALSACNLIEVHTTIEEELVYPILRDEVDGNEADAAEEEHAEATELIAAIRDLEPGDDELPALMQDLMRAIAAHVDHEETSIIPRLQAYLGPRAEDVGREVIGLRQELMGGDRPAGNPKPSAHKVANAGWNKGNVANAGW